MDFTEADDEVFALFEEGGEALFATVKTTAYPETYRAMFGFCAKTNALKTAMFDVLESANPYAFKALLRCYCEHYLKFMYLWVRFLREKSDAVGVEYFSYCGAHEARDYAAALAMSEGLLGHSICSDVESMIDAVFPKAATLSPRELEAASGQFRYRSILRFLSRDVPQLLAADRPFLARIVPSYAELSSFVHGGPWTDTDMYGYSKPEALEKCEKDAGLVFMMTATVLMFTAMAVSREFPPQATFAGRINAVLKRYQAGSPKGES
jgi:hypothetical protein